MQESASVSKQPGCAAKKAPDVCTAHFGHIGGDSVVTLR